VKTYRAVLRLSSPPPYIVGHRALDAAALRESLGRLIAHEITSTPWGQTTLDVTLRRGSHDTALNDLFVLTQQLGYTLLNGEIAAFVSDTVEGVILGGTGSGVVGATSENGWVALVASVLGAFAGGLIGSKVKRVEAVYQVRPNYQGGWTFVQAPVPATLGGLANA
jgi:hypothetical protein